jgi:hypothetical protein
MTIVVSAGVSTFNSLELAGWWVAPICLSWLVAGKFLTYLIPKYLPARCPQCGQRCTMLVSPSIVYKCLHCSYRWDTGLSDSGGSGSLN